MSRPRPPRRVTRPSGSGPRGPPGGPRRVRKNRKKSIDPVLCGCYTPRFTPVGMGLLFEVWPRGPQCARAPDGIRRRRSSTVEHPICNRKVAGSSPIAGSNVADPSRSIGQSKDSFRFELGQVAEWLMAADCKSAALRATEVRILPCPPLGVERKTSNANRACAFRFAFHGSRFTSGVSRVAGVTQG